MDYIFNYITCLHRFQNNHVLSILPQHNYYAYSHSIFSTRFRSNSALIREILEFVSSLHQCWSLNLMSCDVMQLIYVLIHTIINTYFQKVNDSKLAKCPREIVKLHCVIFYSKKPRIDICSILQLHILLL